ncbi:MAG: modification methylase [miscellaneous Crenarchaeota group-6 archaeon AD8-1]|nr:MAG: modification methylase [miscellaneous Crenarchaeota group-6 archaeon AD8-1]
MKTHHKLSFSNSNNMNEIEDESIDLIVTSPPYPMIEMWDKVFSEQNPIIKEKLNAKNGNDAFELMNQELDKVWKEGYRVLKHGGFACINVGDATRKIGKEFKIYMNHSRILQFCEKLGFSCLPAIIWKKQTNSPSKFMGSGMLPAGAYVTLEHEFILVLRKGNNRLFTKIEEKSNRKQSAFFWEERNIWFSDIWEGLKGIRQNNINKEIRAKSAAFPFELAYRLINMYSLKKDHILDPFLGTGTTTIASIVAGRNSIGFEINKKFKNHISSRFDSLVDFSNQIIENRLKNHIKFVEKQLENQNELNYKSTYYDFPVMTRQETEILFDELKKITRRKKSFEITYQKYPTFYFKKGLIIKKRKLSISN